VDGKASDLTQVDRGKGLPSDIVLLMYEVPIQTPPTGMQDEIRDLGLAYESRELSPKTALTEKEYGEKHTERAVSLLSLFLQDNLNGWKQELSSCVGGKIIYLDKTK
jgi:hypothetical protein